jgi:hypothetical protein
LLDLSPRLRQLRRPNQAASEVPPRRPPDTADLKIQSRDFR